MNLYFQQVQIGGYDSNFSYLVGDAESKEVVVVDPDNLPMLKSIVESEELVVVGILLTHGHFDHVVGCKALSEELNIPVYMHKNNPMKNKLVIENVRLLEDASKIEVGEISILAMETLGHTQDSICYFLSQEQGGPKLITGDTLFIDGCGRCDLEGGNAEQMYVSLYEKIGGLPNETSIFPGHDYGKVPFDSLKNQKATNHYLKCTSKSEFVDTRM